MTNISLDDVLAGFNPSAKGGKKRGSYLTLYIPPEVKDTFNALQENSGKAFGKELVKVVVAVIERSAKSG